MVRRRVARRGVGRACLDTRSDQDEVGFEDGADRLPRTAGHRDRPAPRDISRRRHDPAADAVPHAVVARPTCRPSAMRTVAPVVRLYGPTDDHDRGGTIFIDVPLNWRAAWSTSGRSSGWPRRGASPDRLLLQRGGERDGPWPDRRRDDARFHLGRQPSYEDLRRLSPGARSVRSASRSGSRRPKRRHPARPLHRRRRQPREDRLGRSAGRRREVVAGDHVASHSGRSNGSP